MAHAGGLVTNALVCRHGLGDNGARGGYFARGSSALRHVRVKPRA